MKYYTIVNAQKMIGLKPSTIRFILDRDEKKEKKLRRWPNARRCDCGLNSWLIPDTDLKNETLPLHTTKQR